MKSAFAHGNQALIMDNATDKARARCLKLTVNNE